MDKDREEVLLKEYEICEQDSNSASANNWTVIGIFSTVSVGSLAVVVFKLIDIQNSNYNWQSLGFVIILACTAIIVLMFLKQWTSRVTFLLGNNNLRMREIEKILGMYNNIRIWERDNWDDMPSSVKKRLVDSFELLCSRCEKKVKCEQTKTECEDYKNDLANRNKLKLPKGLRSPSTGRNILGRFFNLLFIMWGATILYSLALLILSIVNPNTP